MTNFVLKSMNYAFKMMDFVLKMKILMQISRACTNEYRTAEQKRHLKQVKLRQSFQNQAIDCSLNEALRILQSFMLSFLFYYFYY